MLLINGQRGRQQQKHVRATPRFSALILNFFFTFGRDGIVDEEKQKGNEVDDKDGDDDLKKKIAVIVAYFRFNSSPSNLNGLMSISTWDFPFSSDS